MQPRTPIDLAVAMLYEVAFENMNQSMASVIAGAEWWIQYRKGHQGIGFHYDKDEGIASEQQWMKMPAFSTVT